MQNLNDKHEALGKITKADIKRLCRRAGIKRIEEITYETIRSDIMSYLGELLRNTLILTEYNKRVTIKAIDVQAASKSTGLEITVSSVIQPFSHPKGQKGVKGKKGPKVQAKKEKSGVVALREIRRYQANPNLLINGTRFERLVRAMVSETKDNFRFEKQALLVIQFLLEEHLYRVLYRAMVFLVNDCGRQTLKPKDVHLAVRSFSPTF